MGPRMREDTERGAVMATSEGLGMTCGSRGGDGSPHAGTRRGAVMDVQEEGMGPRMREDTEGGCDGDEIP